MAVVDSTGVARGVRWRHLTADPTDGLRAFAAGMGLGPPWFPRRAKAIAVGALEVDARAVVSTTRRLAMERTKANDG